MIVVDTNVVVFLALDTPQTQTARQIRDDDSDWRIPYLWRSEFRNTMAKYMRSGSLTLQDALNAIEFAEETLFGKEYAANSVRVMELVATSACSAYDCEYVALALRLEVPLVTADRRVLREFPDVAVSLETFARREG